MRIESPPVYANIRFILGPPKHPDACQPGKTLRTVGRIVGKVGAVWTMVVEFVDPASWERAGLVKIAYLVDDAPHHQMTAGSKIELLAGLQVIAKGVILSSPYKDA